MRSFMGRGLRGGWWLGFLAWALVLGGASVLWAQAPAPVVVRVEEDWEMVVATPDPDIAGPQVTCVISPTGSLAGVYAAFELNQRSLPSFHPGGLQLQLWSGDRPVFQTPGPSAAVMSTAGETVRWTQVMRVADGVVVFEVVNGSSATWGAFGGSGYLKLFVPAGLGDLNAYSPEVSVQHSGVGFAGNRVQSLVLKRVRYQLSTGEVLEDGTARVVHSLQ
ncbi:MAG: hypothetical protein NUV77_26740 [Thermoguttaceae bacterium]|nr:hypothetical protein [Thermoguttaceae bacterium]